MLFSLGQVLGLLCNPAESTQNTHPLPCGGVLRTLRNIQVLGLLCNPRKLLKTCTRFPAGRPLDAAGSTQKTNNLFNMASLERLEKPCYDLHSFFLEFGLYGSIIKED